MQVLREDLVKKWTPILEHTSMPEIKDNYRKQVTAVLLENQEKALREEKQILSEASPTNSSGSYADTNGVAKFDPVLISLVRRAAPQLIAYDIAGVQPMTQPTGLVFAMRSRYGNQGGTEAFYNEADTERSGADMGTDTNQTGLSGSNWISSVTTGRGMSNAQAEGGHTSSAATSGDAGPGSTTFNEMAF